MAQLRIWTWIYDLLLHPKAIRNILVSYDAPLPLNYCWCELAPVTHCAQLIFQLVEIKINFDLGEDRKLVSCQHFLTFECRSTVSAWGKEPGYRVGWATHRRVSQDCTGKLDRNAVGLPVVSRVGSFLCKSAWNKHLWISHLWGNPCGSVGYVLCRCHSSSAPLPTPSPSPLIPPAFPSPCPPSSFVIRPGVKFSAWRFVQQLGRLGRLDPIQNWAQLILPVTVWFFFFRFRYWGLRCVQQLTGAYRIPTRLLNGYLWNL